MAKGILSGSGIVNFYDSNNNIIFHSPTLMDSTLASTITKEEVRGGQGADLLGNYFHTSALTVTCTDPIFDMNVLAFTWGGAITAGATVQTIESITTTVANQITVTGTPAPFTETSGVIGWYKLQSEDDSHYRTITFTGKVATVPSLAVGTSVCIKYPIISNSARMFRVNSQFIPSIVRCELVYSLFRASTTGQMEGNSSKIGNIIVRIPQFQFDGNVTLSLSSTTSATVPLTGTALANYTGACDGKGWYAEIIEDIFNQDEFSNVTSIAIADSDIQLGSGDSTTLLVMKLYNDGTVASKVSSNSLLTFIAEPGKTDVFTVTADGVITAGTTTGSGNITIIVTDKPSLTGSALVSVVV